MYIAHGFILSFLKTDGAFNSQHTHTHTQTLEEGLWLFCLGGDTLGLGGKLEEAMGEDGDFGAYAASKSGCLTDG